MLTLCVRVPPTTSFLMYYWHSPTMVIDQYTRDSHDKHSPQWLETVLTILDAAPVIEEKIFVAGALNPLQELLGDDLVGIDVGQGQRGGGAGEDLDGFH